MQRIKLKKIEYSEWNSQETNCFQAFIYFDNKKVGLCSNEGHGGNTWCQWNDREDRPKYEEMLEYCKTLPPINYGNFEIESNIENVCDKLFENWLKEKEDKKMVKKFDKGICYGNDLSYQVSQFSKGGKAVTITELLKDINGINHLKTFCEQKKREGHNIFNTNLPFEV